MTGYESKRAAALDEGRVFDKLGNKVKEDDDDTQIYGDALTIAYQSGYYDGKKAAQPEQERNFCPRCGKRTNDIHTCTPPQDKNT